MTPLRDPQAVLIAGILLLMSAIFTLLYGPVVPLLPGVVDRPEPLGAVALAAVGLLAAYGIWRREAWGRVLGVAITAILLLRDVLYVATGRSLEVVSVLLDLVLLYVLIRGAWRLPDALRRD
jgi:hypothetical protein